jgi:FGFR1 oncogene partner
MMVSTTADAEADSLSNLTSIVTTALEARGVLGKIRAELRASVFSAIHEQQQSEPHGGMARPALLHQDSAGRVAAQLVLDLLQHCQLDYSYSVLVPEADLNETSLDRGALAGALSLDAGTGEPLLVQLVRAALTADLPQPTGARPPAGDAAGEPAAASLARAVVKDPSKPLTINITSKPEPSRGGSGPLTPPSPLSPLPSQGMGAHLPPLSSRASLPPLGVTGASSPSPAAMIADEHLEERRLEALESKLASLGSSGAPLRPGGASTGGAQLAPLSRHHTPALPPSSSALGSVGIAAGATVWQSSQRMAVPTSHDEDEEDDDEYDQVEDDIAEESFEDDDDDEDEDDAGVDLSSGAAAHSGPALIGAASPAHLSRPPGHHRARLSPLETSMGGASMVSVDESVSPGRLGAALQGFDLAESIERP